MSAVAVLDRRLQQAMEGLARIRKLLPEFFELILSSLEKSRPKSTTRINRQIALELKTHPLEFPCPKTGSRILLAAATN